MLDHEFTLKPSRQYLGLLSVIIIATIVILLLVPIVWWQKSIGMILLAAYCTPMIMRFGLLRGKHAIIGLKRGRDDNWIIHTNQGVYEAQLKGDSTVTSWVSVLRFQTGKRFEVFSCLVFRDSLETELYRSLMLTIKE